MSAAVAWIQMPPLNTLPPGLPGRKVLIYKPSMATVVPRPIAISSESSPT